jgi:hypothetical protein
MSELTTSVGLHHVEIKSFGEDVRISGLTDAAIKISGV